MGKRILVAVAVALLLTIAATGCKGTATKVVTETPSYVDDIAKKADEAAEMADDASKMADDAGGSEPGSVPTPQIDPSVVKDAPDAVCRAKNSSEGNTEADGSCGSAG